MAKSDQKDSPVTAEGAVIAPQTVNTDKVDGIAISHTAHATAKEMFASLLATAEEDVKAIAREIGTLLHLHTKASNSADMTGDYVAGDLNK
ncbi:hypothetical protein HX776_24350 [Pseudomonas agarici]|uniref:hypothetical protein n=1 Tax=Pseudomonas agarici TaxID=46677 RepID=UPI000373BCB4|nr:hypothetical protein [Pseudomonas agarici]NWC11922.1 hypothetical protein [Pseudomonas agarici]SEL85395.1 hypothetical protein SAMN05216604_1409 [Pseudomonas agarici]